MPRIGARVRKATLAEVDKLLAERPDMTISKAVRHLLEKAVEDPSLLEEVETSDD
jgi:hypothetical protein